MNKNENNSDKNINKKYSYVQNKILNKFKDQYKTKEKEEELDNKKISNFERKIGKRISVKYQNIETQSLLGFPEIKFPIQELKGFPIINSGTNELIYIYFPKEYYEHLTIILLKEFKYLYAKSKYVINDINKFVFFVFKKYFEISKLEDRIEKSYVEPLSTQKTCFSIVLEMNEKFKNKPKIKEKLINFRNFGKEIKKFSNIIKQEYNPFESLNPSNKKEKKNYHLIEKIGLTFLDKGKEKNNNFLESDDDEIFLELKNKNSINQNENEEKYNYNEILMTIFYNRINDFRKDIIEYCLNQERKKISFEKFVCYIEFFICLFTGIRVKYYIDELSYLNLDFYAEEITLMNLAETFHYQVQFKIFDLPIKKKKNGKFFNREEEEVDPFRFNILKKQKLFTINSKLYENFEENNIENYPPYNDFIKALSHKYRRYDKNDNFHICNSCCGKKFANEVYNIDCSSCFRKIDKIRLISVSLSTIVDFDFFNFENDSNVFKYSILMPNYKPIKHSVNFYLILFSCLNPLNVKENKLLNKIFRNTYGEYVGFYFSWLFCYIKWLIFPSIFGLIVHFIKIFHFSNLLSLYIELLFCGFIILWGNFFVQYWKAREKFLCYIWGMKNFRMERRIDILKYNSNDIEFFIGVRIPVYYPFDNFIKKTFIFFVAILSQVIQISLNLLIFMIQSKKIFLKKQNNELLNYDIWAYLCPIICFLIREFSSSFYNKINLWLNSFESYLTKEEYKKGFLNKKILFEFSNYYFNLYYIAFVKRYFDTCYLNDCYQELGNQLTMILLSDMICTLIRFIYNFIYLSEKIAKFEGRILNKYINARNSSKKYVFYTKVHCGHEDITQLFLPIILNFGYIVQFGSASPISLSFMLLLTIFFKITDTISFKYLKYVRTYKDSKGLGLFNDILKISAYFGLISNLCIIFYTRKNFIILDKYNKLIAFVIIQNVLFMCIKLISYKFFPYWFPFRTRVEIKYLKKHGVRQKDILQKIKSN